MDYEKELQAARENVARLQAQKQQVDILLTKWVGIVEYLTAKAKEAAEAAKEPKKPKEA